MPACPTAIHWSQHSIFEGAVSYEIIWEPRGVIKRFSGLMTGNEMIQSVVDVEKDARFDELRYAINDFLGVTGISLTKDCVEEISVMDKGAACTNPHIRNAVVATHPEIIALANEYANSNLNAYPTKIFPSLAEARSWLGETNPRK
jgi:hypothetical protein